MSSVVHLVFSQNDQAVLPLDRLASQARAHFDASFTLEPEVGSGAASRLSYRAGGLTAVFDVSTRSATAEDAAAAREAERLGSSGGLADLAKRCTTIWLVEPSGEPPEWLVLHFCALLASVALGPILTADRSRLLGVRSARERSDTLRGGPRLMK